MIRYRNLMMFALGLVLALGLSACQKNQENELSSTGENPATTAEPSMTDPAPVVTETPVEEPAPAPAKAPPAKPKYPPSTNVAAKSNNISLPAGTKFDISLTTPVRSEERRVGKECGYQCRSRWSPYH